MADEKAFLMLSDQCIALRAELDAERTARKAAEAERDEARGLVLRALYFVEDGGNLQHDMNTALDKWGGRWQKRHL